MKMHEFIDGTKPVMVLIHGVLCPWQLNLPYVKAFQESYNVYVPALSAHTEEEASHFATLKNEVEELIQYFLQQNISTIDVLCGLSLGGKIAHEIWMDGRLKINHLVMDGAPLVSCPKFLQNIMVKNYIDIIHKSKVRDKKVLESFKKNFLPEKYLDSYLKIADHMTDDSMKNIVLAAFSGGEIRSKVNGSNANCNNLTKREDTRILFLHGTKGNEILSKKAAKRTKEHHPQTEIICFKGDMHCQKAIYEPDVWIEVVEKFLTNTQK